MEIPIHVRILRFESAGQLADESEGYYLAFAAASPAAFAEALRAVRSLPPWQRAWLPLAQVWWIHEDGLTMLARRLPELQSLLWRTAFDRARGTSAAQTQRLLYNLAPRHVRDAFALLSLRCDASADEVKAAYRVQAKRAHPDTGGSHAAMLALNAAYAYALGWSEQGGVFRTARDGTARATAAAR
jgi:hypothetical protein